MYDELEDRVGDVRDKLLLQRESLLTMRDVYTTPSHVKRHLSIAITQVENAILRLDNIERSLNGSGVV